MFVTYFNATLFNVPFHEIKCRVVVVIFIYNIHTHTPARILLNSTRNFLVEDILLLYYTLKWDLFFIFFCDLYSYTIFAVTASLCQLVNYIVSFYLFHCFSPAYFFACLLNNAFRVVINLIVNFTGLKYLGHFFKRICVDGQTQINFSLLYIVLYDV